MSDYFNQPKPISEQAIKPVSELPAKIASMEYGLEEIVQHPSDRYKNTKVRVVLTQLVPEWANHQQAWKALKIKVEQMLKEAIAETEIRLKQEGTVATPQQPSFNQLKEEQITNIPVSNDYFGVGVP